MGREAGENNDGYGLLPRERRGPTVLGFLGDLA